MMKIFKRLILLLLLLSSQSVWACGSKVASDESSGSLRDAAEVGDVAKVTDLLKAGHNANDRDVRGRSALHNAALIGHAQVVQVLIKEGKADVNAKSLMGYTPLHFAARNGYIEVARVLIEAKADVNAKDKKGEVPLDWAATNGNLEIVQLLVNSGADPGIKNPDGRTPLEEAIYRKKFAVANYLRNYSLPYLQTHDGKGILTPDPEKLVHQYLVGEEEAKGPPVPAEQPVSGDGSKVE